MPRSIAKPQTTPLTRIDPDQAPPVRSVPHHPEHRPFVIAAHRLVAGGQRPFVRVLVVGLDGLLVRLVVVGMPGSIAHARTRRRAREIARASVASILQLDPYSFDLVA